MNTIPLRYNISDWHQAVQCLSNNSEHLHINVLDYVQNDSIRGTKISVIHDMYGTLFAYIVDAVGELASDVGPMLSTKTVLRELRRYGFDVTYDQKAHLSGDQLQFLMTLKAMQFDKLRLLTVIDPNTQTATTYVVVFKIEQHPNWLDNEATVYKKEFTDAVTVGSAFNVSLVSPAANYRWDWLDFVADIDQILNENAGD